VETSIIALRPSPVRDVDGITRAATTPEAAQKVIAAVRNASRPQLVLVDDADLVDDGGLLASLIQSMARGAHVVAAVRTDALRSGYGHWTRELRRSRLGIALAPQPEDGDLFGATFPRRMLPPNRPGCGLLVIDGRPVTVQVGF
jgi:S-DNA-T family DNA segregation ATPase FtsK/SpoIIIE